MVEAAEEAVAAAEEAVKTRQEGARLHLAAGAPVCIRSYSPKWRKHRSWAT